MNTSLNLMRSRIEHSRRNQYKGFITITNSRLQNYVEERGIQPVREEGNKSVYVRSRKLIDLLECFEIENYILPNR